MSHINRKRMKIIKNKISLMAKDKELTKLLSITIYLDNKIRQLEKEGHETNHKENKAKET